MKEIEIYVAKAFNGTPDSPRKEELMQEIVQRLEQSAGFHMEAGKAREDAVNKAIVDFGELSELLAELKGSGESRVPSNSALWFSVVGSLIIIALMLFINFYYTPNIIWCVYPIFAILWWPLCMLFFGKWRRGK